MRIVRLASQRLRWWRFYLLLLVASQLVTLIWPKPPLPGPEDRVALLTRQSANGPLPGKPVRLVYRDVGAGEPVILLHGSPGAIADYRYLEPELTKSFRVIIPDLPGFGRSERWLPDYGIKAEARYVLALMDFLKLERAQLIGFSMGSGVALHVADLAPQRVASLTLCGGIGIQEGEGSGDYWCEHLKYAAGYAGLVVLPELVPHFGLLGSRSFRHTFVRSFWDTDQRPLRGILERLRAPLLILHGCHDPLVPEWVAEEHHKLAPNSEMVMFDDGHFMLSSHKGCECLAAEMAPFLARHCDPDAVAQSRTVDHSPPNFVSSQMLPGVNLTRSVGPWAQMGALFAGTFASEDLTSIAAGLLIREGQVDWFVGILACFLGIFVSDLGL